MASKPAHSRPHRRPRSPHLFSGPMAIHYRWSAAMLVSILHRATGDGMATIGTMLFVWWLAALAAGEGAYATFVGTFTTDAGGLNVFGWIVGVGLTFSILQHMASGVRHLVMDTGAAFELKANRNFARATFAFSITLTVVFWFLMGTK